MPDTEAKNSAVEQAVGVIQTVNDGNRTMTILVNGASTVFDVALDCLIFPLCEPVNLRLLRKGESVRVIYLRTPNGRRIQAMEAISSCPLSPGAHYSSASDT